jgi:hypothetical protein
MRLDMQFGGKGGRTEQEVLIPELFQFGDHGFCVGRVGALDGRRPRLDHQIAYRGVGLRNAGAVLLGVGGDKFLHFG